MQVKGEVIHIGDTEQVTEKFSKREIVLKLDGDTEYPQEVSFQLAQSKCALADSVKFGDIIEVDFNLKGRPWVNNSGVTQWFNTLDAYKITPSF